MTNYINADKLKAEIERLQKFSNSMSNNAINSNMRNFYDGEKDCCKKLLLFIDSLQQEQPEVDLEKALNGLDNAYFDLDGIAVKGATYYLTVNDLKDIARDFYELGLKVRK